MEAALDNYVIRGASCIMLMLIIVCLTFSQASSTTSRSFATSCTSRRLCLETLRPTSSPRPTPTASLVTPLPPTLHVYDNADLMAGYVLSATQKQQLVAAAVFFYNRRQLQDQRFTNTRALTKAEFYRADLVVGVLGEQHDVTVGIEAYEGYPFVLDFVGMDESVRMTNVSYAAGNPVLSAAANDVPFTLQLVSQQAASMKLSFFGTEFDITVRTQEEQR